MAAAAGRPSYPVSGPDWRRTALPPSPVALYASSLGLPAPLFGDGPLSLPPPLLGSPPATSPEAMYRAAGGAFDFDVNRRRGRRPRPDGTSAPKRKSRDGEWWRRASGWDERTLWALSFFEIIVYGQREALE